MALNSANFKSNNGYACLSNLWCNKDIISVEELYQLKFLKMLGENYYNYSYNYIK